MTLTMSVMPALIQDGVNQPSINRKLRLHRMIRTNSDDQAHLLRRSCSMTDAKQRTRLRSCEASINTTSKLIVLKKWLHDLIATTAL